MRSQVHAFVYIERINAYVWEHSKTSKSEITPFFCVVQIVIITEVSTDSFDHQSSQTTSVTSLHLFFILLSMIIINMLY